MKLFDRYLARAALKGFCIVLLGLVVLISLASFVGELKDVGKGNYGIVDAVAYIGLTTPQRILDLSAISALVGGIIGLGTLASQRELLMLRAFGQSPRRLLLSVGFGALILTIATTVITETVAPASSQEASRKKRVAIESDRAAITAEDLWLRGEDCIVRIGQIEDSGELEDVQIFEFGPKQNLQAVVRAANATIEFDGTWTLRDVRRDELQSRKRTTAKLLEFRGASNRRDLDLLVVAPQDQSLRGLKREIRRLPRASAELETSSRKQREILDRWFWRKLGTLILGGSMLLLALPFAVGSLNPASKGKRLVIGVVIGALIHVAVQAFHYGSEIGDFDPMLTGLLPGILAFVAAVFLTWRLR